MRPIVLCLLPTLLGGCVLATVAGTAVDIVAIPVKVVAAGVDAATTSKAEADQKRGRALRQAEEAAGKRLRLWEAECRKAQAQGEQCPPRPEPPTR